MFNRARQQGEFTDSDIERIRELVPSLSLALHYARELDRARGRTADLEALVLALGDEVPKLLVDADGRILHVQAPVNSPSLGPIITQLRDRGHPVIRAARMLTGDRDGDTPAALLHRIRSPLGTWFRAELALSTGLFRGKPLVIVRLVQEGAKGRAEWSRWRLSRAESSVLTELVAGGTNVEIGNRLFISPETVRTHLTRIFKKLGVRSRLEAVVVALQSRGQKARTR
jgi:DNA-binding CsgD family transcriptional regulator